eukprot:3530002-Pyramimonas_sp.AAC.1
MFGFSSKIPAIRPSPPSDVGASRAPRAAVLPPRAPAVLCIVCSALLLVALPAAPFSRRCFPLAWHRSDVCMFSSARTIEEHP